MLYNKLRWLYNSQNLNDELLQCSSEGKDITSSLAEFECINSVAESEEKEIAAGLLMKKMESLPILKSFPYFEPDNYNEIISTLDHNHTQTYSYDLGGYRSKLYGAWAGRSAGCLLGIPIESWAREKIYNFLKDSGNYPISGYLSSQVSSDIKEKYGIRDKDETTPYDRQKVCWINNIKDFPVDDDTNYTVAALRLIERYGVDFSTDNVAESWLFGFPFMHACTSERVAYKNLINCVLPPLSAINLNPFREFIGAQIRSDFYGYIAPGNPCLAASMAYRDAAVSHVKNGIYGAMYTASLISLAPCSREPLWMVQTAMGQIPSSSRLYIHLLKLCQMFSDGKSYFDIVNYIHSIFDEKIFFDWCHIIPNALIVTVNLLFYGNDFNAAITNTVICGFDTDCNGATIGSIVGMMHGRSSIEGRWLEPLEPRINTSIHSYYLLTFDELVERTYKLVCK